MIKNELQYRVKKAILRKLGETLANHDRLTADEEPWTREIHRFVLEDEIRQLKTEIKEYERIKSGKRPEPPLDVVAKIPAMFIERRIALGWTQQELAKRLGVKPQQVQADEANNYASANLTRLIHTAAVLKQAASKSSRRPSRRAESTSSKKSHAARTRTSQRKAARKKTG
jgi:transcriptional regulator with XRE-family HTH domain